MDEAKLKATLNVIFDFLRMQEAAHPAMVMLADHYRGMTVDNAAAILAELKARGLA